MATGGSGENIVLWSAGRPPLAVGLVLLLSAGALVVWLLGDVSGRLLPGLFGLLLLGGGLALAGLRRIVFRAGGRRLEIVRLFGASRRFDFDDLQDIRSVVELDRENPVVRLELRLPGGEGLNLADAPPFWPPGAPAGGALAVREPPQLAELRRRIAAMTGVRDLG